jgi:hypothetical protein
MVSKLFAGSPVSTLIFATSDIKALQTLGKLRKALTKERTASFISAPNQYSRLNIGFVEVRT